MQDLQNNASGEFRLNKDADRGFTHGAHLFYQAFSTELQGQTTAEIPLPSGSANWVVRFKFSSFSAGGVDEVSPSVFVSFNGFVPVEQSTNLVGTVVQTNSILNPDEVFLNAYTDVSQTQQIPPGTEVKKPITLFNYETEPVLVNILFYKARGGR